MIVDGGVAFDLYSGDSFDNYNKSNRANVKKYRLVLHKFLIQEYPFTKIISSYQKTDNSMFQSPYSNASGE